VEQSLHSHPLAPTDAILDDVRLSLPATTPTSENRATGLAIDTGAELLRLSADHLLRELQARFANIPHVDQHMTETKLFKNVRRRPERPSSSVPYNLILLNCSLTLSLLPHFFSTLHLTVFDCLLLYIVCSLHIVHRLFL